MSIAGYLGPNKPEIGVPKDGEDELAVSAEGPVLSGELPASALRYKESLEATKLGRLDGEKLPGGLKRAGHH